MFLTAMRLRVPNKFNCWDLAGIYTQLTVENLPGPRGIATPLGLNSIAGPWIESIQLSKGTGSVANGFESIAGQINVELKNPETSEKLLPEWLCK